MSTATAHPNIALCKYWGKSDRLLNLPAVPSLSLTLAPFSTTTTVEWGSEHDQVELNGSLADESTRKKVLKVLSLIDPARPPCKVISVNSFPTAAGLASSSSGFAALTLAGAAAAGQDLDYTRLSAIARQGSGSACRSLFGGWVEWQETCGIPVAPEDHWDIRVLVAVVAAGPKETASTDGMLHCAQTSPYYPAWVEQAPEDVAEAKKALLKRDLEKLGSIMERSTLKMHACMMASDPAIFYWRGGTLMVLDRVRELKKSGISCYFTMDAGPNVKIFCEARDAATVAAALSECAARIETLVPGGGARLL
jgi:diphosphomevalonate decarboxylase